MKLAWTIAASFVVLFAAAAFAVALLLCWPSVDAFRLILCGLVFLTAVGVIIEDSRLPRRTFREYFCGSGIYLLFAVTLVQSIQKDWEIAALTRQASEQYRPMTDK